MSDAVSLDFSVPLDFDSEDLDVEFKRSLPLGENSGKAKLAKEICALANHGGGWIVLGREDDGSYPDTLPEELAGADQDTINQIASAYLQPAPHCSVRWMTPKGGTFDVLVIWVSPLGVSPVCGSKNGPNGENGGTVGIRKGIHYIRRAGPVSAPIESPDEWQTVIRRCVLSDKTTLLAALTTMLQQPVSNPEDEDGSVLDADFEHIIEVWKDEASRHPYDVDLRNNFVCYGFHLVDAETTTTDRIRESLRFRPGALRSEHMFFDAEYNSPYRPIVIEVADVAGVEVRATTGDFDLRSAWRMSEALSGAEVISYWEDTAWIKGAVEEKSSRTWERGKAIWIKQQVAYCDNFLAMVKHIADQFDYNGSIRIRVLFSGLRGRKLDSPNAAVYYSLDYEAHQDTKLVDLTVNANALDAEARTSTIAAIIQSMNKLTQGPEITVEGVASLLDSRR